LTESRSQTIFKSNRSDTSSQRKFNRSAIRYNLSHYEEQDDEDVDESLSETFMLGVLEGYKTIERTKDPRPKALRQESRLDRDEETVDRKLEQRRLHQSIKSCGPQTQRTSLRQQQKLHHCLSNLAVTSKHSPVR
jgi:tRNA(Ile)-lysidine synthase TilS/MesJ